VGEARGKRKEESEKSEEKRNETKENATDTGRWR
jgi:hypothetical protein